MSSFDSRGISPVLKQNKILKTHQQQETRAVTLQELIENDGQPSFFWEKLEIQAISEMPITDEEKKLTKL